MSTKDSKTEQPCTIHSVKARYSFPRKVGEWDSRTAGDSEDDYIIKRWLITADENHTGEICIVAVLEVETNDGNCEQAECYRMPFCAVDVDKLTEAFKEVHQWQI